MLSSKEMTNMRFSDLSCLKLSSSVKTVEYGQNMIDICMQVSEFTRAAEIGVNIIIMMVFGSNALRQILVHLDSKSEEQMVIFASKPTAKPLTDHPTRPLVVPDNENYAFFHFQKR